MHSRFRRREEEEALAGFACACCAAETVNVSATTRGTNMRIDEEGVG
jgi:hypothetical protein